MTLVLSLIDLASYVQVSGESSDRGNDSSTTKVSVSAAKEALRTQEELRKSLPLLPKSAVMRLLAELVRSYVGVANLITQHTYSAQTSPLVTEVTHTHTHTHTAKISKLVTAVTHTHTHSQGQHAGHHGNTHTQPRSARWSPR